MENPPLIETTDNDGKEEKVFHDYMKDFSLNEEDLKNPILDVGAGPGHFIKYLRNKLGNSNAYGVEKSGFRLHSGPDGMVVADGFDLPFADNTFEIVVSRNFLPMFTDDIGESRAIINELIRVTKAGGKIIGNISTPKIEIEESKEEIYNGSSSFDKFFKERHDGAVKIQSFLEELKNDGYVVDQKEYDHKAIVTIHKP